MSDKLEDFVPESLKAARRPFERRPDTAEGMDWRRVAGLLIVLGMVGLVVVFLNGGGEGDFVQAIMGLAVCFAGLSIYFLPGYVAARRNHRNATSIFVLNLFLGWTFLGWVAALVWALSSQGKEPR